MEKSITFSPSALIYQDVTINPICGGLWKYTLRGGGQHSLLNTQNNCKKNKTKKYIKYRNRKSHEI